MYFFLAGTSIFAHSIFFPAATASGEGAAGASALGAAAVGAGASAATAVVPTRHASPRLRVAIVFIILGVLSRYRSWRTDARWPRALQGFWGRARIGWRSSGSGAMTKC